ncbi:MAG: SGNH/GDSL hydrolase family protein [Spirosomataceae bacterium]
MKKLLFIALTFSLLAMKQDTPLKVIFFGDSITQAGVGPTGYISKMKQLLESKGLSTKYELVGAGIGGNKVYDLYLRMEDDVLAKKPNVVFLYIGVNDVWHKRTYGTGTDLNKFEGFYTTIIKKLQAQNIKVIACTPAVIGERTDFSNELDGDLNLYSQAIRNLVKKYNVPLCDLRKAFLDYNLQNNKDNKESGILTTDRVHLNEAGNQFVAEQMMKLLVE